MKNEYNALFEKIEPHTSDEELLRAVLDRKAENMSNEKKSRKRILIPVIAAAALAATAVGASAAGGLLNKKFESAFEENYGSASQTDFEKLAGTFDFEKYGATLDKTFENDKARVTFEGIVSADKTCYILYTLEIKDPALEQTPGNLVLRPAMFGIKIDGQRTMLGYRMTRIGEEGALKHYVMEINTDDDRVPDLQGKTLNIECDLEKFGASPDEDMKVLEGLTLDIPIGFSPLANARAETSAAVSLGGKDAVIAEVEVSPFTTMVTFAEKVEVSVASSDFDDFMAALKGSYITLRDGSRIELDTRGFENGILQGFTNTYPLDPANAVSVTIGGKTIEF